MAWSRIDVLIEKLVCIVSSADYSYNFIDCLGMLMRLNSSLTLKSCMNFSESFRFVLLNRFATFSGVISSIKRFEIMGAVFLIPVCNFLIEYSVGSRSAAVKMGFSGSNR